MAHVYWNERASRYYMRYSGAAPGGGRKWRTKAAPETWTKKQAEAMAHELERGAEMGEATTADVEVATLSDLCGWWLEHWCKPASVKRERSRLSVNVMGRALGATPLKKVTPQLIEARLREMERDGAASASVEHVRRALRRIFNCARKSKVWTANPAAEASPRSMDSKRAPTTLKPDEVVSVIQATPTPWKRDLVAVALGTGMRKGELLGLRKTSVDSERRTVTVSHSYDRETTKGGHTDTIPFPEWLKPFLAHAIAASDGETVFPAASGGTRSEHTDAVAIIQVAMKAAGLVAGWEHVCRRCKARATKGQGEPYSEQRPVRNDELRCPRCGMRLWATPITRPFRFHDLRHTAATLMILAGGKPHEVQRILRHKSLDTTMRIYAHLFAEDLRPVVNLLPAVPPPVETSASARVALLSHSALPVEIRGPESQVKTPENSGPSDGARYWIRTSGLRLRRGSIHARNG